MGRILGIGTTHSPPLSLPPAAAAAYAHAPLDAPNADPSYKDRSRWPQGMREEMGADEAATGWATHGARLIENLRCSTWTTTAKVFRTRSSLST